MCYAIKTFYKSTIVRRNVVPRKHWILIAILVSCLFINTLVILSKPAMIGDFFYSGNLNETKTMEIIFLGLIQGITEWFPISSSGHLVLVQELLNINVSVAFDVMLHLGTLVGVMLFLGRDITTILKAVSKLDFSNKEGQVFIYVIVGTIPTALIGFLLKDVFEAMFSNLFSTGVAMLVNSILLYSTKYSKPRRELNVFDSLLIGFAQAVAITPGISRTGATISTALLRGVESSEAYRFSLLLSVLTIVGGSIVKLRDVNFKQESSMIILGFLISAAVGFLALRFVRKYLIKQSFHKFAYYCLLVGVFALFLSIVRSP
jgi:undecaprenyl-diphosphatase